MFLVNEGSRTFFGIPKQGVAGVCLSCTAIFLTEHREPGLVQHHQHFEDLGELDGWAKPCPICAQTNGGLVFFVRTSTNWLTGETTEGQKLDLPSLPVGAAGIIARLHTNKQLPYQRRVAVTA